MSLGIIIIITILICMTLLWIRWRRQKMSLFQRYGIPGPPPNIFLGNLVDFNKGRNDCIEEWLRKYGKIFGFYLGAKPYLVCADVEFLKLCQIKNANNFYNKDWVLPDIGVPHNSVFNSLGVQKDEKWKNLRSILSTCFTTGKVKLMSLLMSRPIKIFLQNVEKRGEQPFNISELLKPLVFDIVATSAFGVTTNIQNNENNKFIKSVHIVFESDSSDIFTGLSVCFPEIEPVCRFIRQRIDSLKYTLGLPSISVVHETCKNIIESRKKLGHRPQDLLQTIIDAEADDEDESVSVMKKLSENYVIANALMFMTTGYDTTKTTLLWCIHHLSRNPEIQEKIRNEIRNNVKDEMEIEYSDLSNFPMLNQVILETLRFWSFNLLTVNRLCSKDYQYKGMTIPKGCIITVPVATLQTDPEYWNKPQKFDPDRFSSKNRVQFDSIIYQPFGAGPRICIAQRLAKTVIRLVLANLIRSFKLEAYGDEKVELQYGLLIHEPKNGVFVKAIQLTS